MQLKPGETFTIVRQLDNPADAGTYYVRAIIRNSRTDVIIETLNLDNKGSQRFTKSWQVVPDSSGEGFYIDIETRVFTDSGYSTYSDIYGKENKVLLVADRPLNLGGGGVDMSVDVDYSRIGKMIADGIKQNKPQAKETDLSGIMSRLGQITAQIAEIKQPEGVDLSPITSAIADIKKQIGEVGTDIAQKIEDKEVTPATDLKPVLDMLEDLDPSVILETLKRVAEHMHEFLGGDVQKIITLIGEVKKQIDDVPFMPIYTKGKEAIQEETPLQTRKRKI